MQVKSRIVTFLAVVLVAALIILVPLSWLLSVEVGEDVHSLLSSEGIRFFMGGFVSQLQHPLLIWLLLLSMAYGCAKCSGIADLLRHPFSRRNRQPLIFLTVLLLFYVGVIMLLTVSPQAVLLSSTGGLCRSPFSRALVPVLSFGVVVLSVVYGVMARRFLTFTAVLHSLEGGIAQAAPLLLLYVLAMQLGVSLRFVFF